MPWIIFRTIAIIAGSSFFGSALASQPPNVTDKTGFVGWWSSLPPITKVVAWIAVITGAVAIYNYFTTGSIKGRKGGNL